MVLTSLLDHAVRTSSHGKYTDVVAELIEQLVTVARQREPTADLRWLEMMVHCHRYPGMQHMFTAPAVQQHNVQGQGSHMQGSSAVHPSCYQRALDVSAKVQSSTQAAAAGLMGRGYLRPAMHTEYERSWANFDHAMQPQGRSVAMPVQGYDMTDGLRDPTEFTRRAFSGNLQQAGWIPQACPAPENDNFWTDNFFAEEPFPVERQQHQQLPPGYAPQGALSANTGHVIRTGA